MILIKTNKSGKLGPQKVKKDIAFILLDEFFNCFNCTKKSIVW